MLGGGKGSGGGEGEGPGVYRGPESRVVEVERDVGEGCPFKELQRAGPSPFCLSKSCPSPKALLKSNWCWRPVLPKPQPSTHYLQQITHFIFFLFNIINLLGCARSQLQHVNSVAACGIWFSDQG